MDKRIAFIGAIGFACTGIALLIRVGEPLYGASSLLACFACAGYLLLRKRVTLLVSAPDRTMLYDAGWLVAWGTAIAVYALRPEPYERPLAFFVFVALSCGFIVAKVIRCQLSSKDIAITLTQAVAIGLSLVWTVTLMYPSLVGLDPWTHRGIVLSGLDTGEWLAYPAGHRAWYIFVATVMQTTGLEYRLATMAVSFVQVVGGALMLFLLGRRIAGTRVGLLAALILSFSSWHIFFGYWTIPNGLGLILLLLAVYLVIKYHDKASKWLAGTAALAVLLLLFTHTLAIVWLIALLCIWTVLVLTSGCRLTRGRVLLPLVGVGVSVGTLWAIGPLSQLLELLFTYGLNPIRTGLTQLPGLVGNGATGTFFLDTIAQPSWETVFNASGMVLGFVIAIAGCLWLLSKPHRSTSSWFVVVSFCFFLATGIVPALFGMSVIEHRWWYTAQAFGVIPVAVAVISLHKVGKGVVVAAGVAVLSFLMMIGLPCNMDNYTFSKNQLVRYALTQGELDAAEWALAECDSSIGVDAYYTFVANMLPKEQGDRLVGINKEILSKDYDSLEHDIILIRDAIAYEPFALGEGRVYKLLYDPNVELIASGYELVYSAGGVNGYVREETDGG